jgi:hypothetical protein
MPTVSKHPAYCWRVDARASGQHDSPIAGVHTDDSLRLSLSGDVEMAAQVNRGTRRKVEQQQDGIRLLVQAEADGSLRFPDGDRPSARPWCCQAGRQTICKTVYLSVRPSVPAYPTNVADRRLLCYSSDTKSMLYTETTVMRLFRVEHSDEYSDESAVLQEQREPTTNGWAASMQCHRWRDVAEGAGCAKRTRLCIPAR